MSHSEDRPFAPTPRRRAEARQRGHVPHSRPLTNSLLLLAVCGYAAWSGGDLVLKSATQLRDGLSHSSVSTASVDLVGQVQRTAVEGLEGIVGLLILSLAGAVVADLVQTGATLSWSRVLPDTGRVNPLTGLSRITQGLSPLRWLPEGARRLAVLGLLGGLAWLHRNDIARLTCGDLIAGTTLTGSLLVAIAGQLCAALLIAGLAHGAWTRRQYERSLRMIREEMREESAGRKGRRTVVTSRLPAAPLPPIAD